MHNAEFITGIYKSSKHFAQGLNDRIFMSIDKNCSIILIFLTSEDLKAEK